MGRNRRSQRNSLRDCSGPTADSYTLAESGTLSSDNSTNNIPVNVLRITNPLSFAHQWLVEKVRGGVEFLLQNASYDAVLFAELDELVFLNTSEFDGFSAFFGDDRVWRQLTEKTLRANGFHVVHSAGEADIDFERPIFTQRSRWTVSMGLIKKALYGTPFKVRTLRRSRSST